jgi:hypothetical protein
MLSRNANKRPTASSIIEMQELFASVAEEENEYYESEL